MAADIPEGLSLHSVNSQNKFSRYLIIIDENSTPKSYYILP